MSVRPADVARLTPRRGFIFAFLLIAGLTDPRASARADEWMLLGPPSGRVAPAAAVDLSRNRWIVIGGYDGQYHADVWGFAMDGSGTWTPVATQGTGPGPLMGASAVYDSLHDRIVFFGGRRNSAASGGLWTLDLGASPALWTLVTPSGPAPAPRDGHSAVVDESRRRMLVSGGRLTGWVPTNDTWALDLDALSWTQITAGSPPPARADHAAVFDVDHDRMIVIGGSNGSTTLSDIWALDFGSGLAWSALLPSNPTTPRAGHVAVLDRSRNRVVVSSGQTTGPSVQVLSLSTPPQWQGVMSPSFPSYDYGVACLDRSASRVLVWGGMSPNTGRTWINEMVGLDLALPWSWSVVNPTTSRWSSRGTHAGVLDPEHDRMVVYGGLAFSHQALALNDVWALPLANPAERIQLWPAGSSAPDSLYDPNAIYDPVRKRMWVFGTVIDNLTSYPQSWSFDLTNGTGWTQIHATGAPASGWFDAAAVYDPVRDRAIVVGKAAGGPERGVWTMPLGGPPAWTLMPTSGPAPENRAEHAMVYDPVRDRVLLFGGYQDGERLDLWELPLAGPPVWNRLMDAPDSPGFGRGLLSVAMVFDPSRDRLVTFGGIDDLYPGPESNMDTTAWELPLGTDSLVWHALTPSGPTPSGRERAVAIYDAMRDRMVMMGGTNLDQQFSDVMLLQFPGPLAVPRQLPTGLALAPPFPNPSRDGMRLSFSLPASGRARLRLFDLQGRHVATLVDRDLPAGLHKATWDGRNSSKKLAETGVYFLKLQAGGECSTRRIVRVR